jgi:uncharacterized membrane protein
VTEPEPANSARTLDRERGRYRPERLMMLVDGVFAISMTLLVLDVRVPDAVPDAAAAFAQNAGVLFGRLGVFVAAFLITSRFWLVHHRQMAVLEVVDVGVLERTILFLAAITSLPVATGVLFRFGDVPAAVAFAAVVLAVTAALSARLWWYLSSPERGLAHIGRDDRHRIMLRSMIVVVVYLLALPLAYALPPRLVAYTPLVWLVLVAIDPLTARLYDRFGRRRARAG